MNPMNPLSIILPNSVNAVEADDLVIRHGTAKPPEFNGDLDQTALVLKRLLESVEKIEKSGQEWEELIKRFRSKGKDQDYPRLVELLKKLQLSTDFLSTNLSSYKGELNQAICDVTQIKESVNGSFNAKSDCIKCLFWNSNRFPKAAQTEIRKRLEDGKIDLCIIVEAHIKTVDTKTKIESHFSGYDVIFVEEKKLVFTRDKTDLGRKTNLINPTDYHESTAIDNVLSYTHCVIIYRKDVNNKTENLTCDGYFMEYKPPNDPSLYKDHFFSFKYRNLNFLALHRSNKSVKAHTLVLKNWIPKTKKNCVVVGDVNWDYKNEKSKKGKHFHNMLTGFHQWVSEPTRGDKIIDVVFTRKEELEVATDVQTFYDDQEKKIGDHKTVIFTVSFVDHKDSHGDAKPGPSSQ